MKKIDAHHHCWRFHPEKHTWIDDRMKIIQRDFSPEDLQPRLGSNEVEATVIVQVDQDPTENHFLLAMAQKAGFIKGIVGWIDLMAYDLTEMLHMWSSEPLMKGFRHIAQGEPDDFLSKAEIIKGIGELGKFGFTYDILIKPPQLEAALQLVRTLPNQYFVIDHLAKPYIAAGEMANWAKDIRAFSNYPNVYCKLSGMVTEADWFRWTYEQLQPYYEVVLETFGPERLMFGSDWPVCLVAASYDDVVGSVEKFIYNLSRSEQESIWYRNAEKFYSINP